MVNTEYQVPPNDLEIEKAILGAIILDSKLLPEIKEIILKEDFYSSQHQEIFCNLVEMYRDDKEIDLLTIGRHLRSKGNDIPLVLANIVNTVPISDGWYGHCKVLRELSLRRKYLKETETLIVKMHDHATNIVEVISTIQTLAGSLDVDNKEDRPIQSIKEILPTTLDKIEMMGKNTGITWGIPTGISGYDKLTGGLHNGDYTVLAGRPGHAKTSLALTMVLNIIEQEGCNVFFQSCEMPKGQLVNKMLAMRSGVGLRDIRQGNVNHEEWGILNKKAGELYNSRLHFCDTSTITVETVKSGVLRLMAKMPIGLVVIDYLQLLQCANRQLHGEQKLSEISRSLKNLAMDLNMPVLVLSQLNRAIENRPDGEPQLSDLRGSGSIEQDADNVFFIRLNRELWRARCYYRKQRNGPLGDFDLVFNSDTTKLSDDNSPMASW